MFHAIDWQTNVEKEIEIMSKQLQVKADRLLTEQILRQQTENIKKLQAFTSDTTIISQNHDDVGPERVCYECVEVGDLSTAFTTILRYIDKTAKTKAESKDVNSMATKSYADSLFERLSVISNQKVRDMTEGLQKALESRLDELMNQFDTVQRDINQKLNATEYNIYQLNQSVEHSKIEEKKLSDKDKQPTKADLLLNRAYQFTSRSELTPRRGVKQKLKKSSDLSKRQLINSYKKTPPDPNKLSLSITKMTKHRDEIINYDKP